MDLGWVDFDLGVPPSCPTASVIFPSAPAELGTGEHTKFRSTQPSPQADGTPCRAPLYVSILGLLPSMQESSGHIVFVSSSLGKMSLPECSGFAASQHAINAFADALRAEVADEGIRITVASLASIANNKPVGPESGTSEKNPNEMSRCGVRLCVTSPALHRSLIIQLMQRCVNYFSLAAEWNREQDEQASQIGGPQDQRSAATRHEGSHGCKISLSRRSHHSPSSGSVGVLQGGRTLGARGRETKGCIELLLAQSFVLLTDIETLFF